MTSIIEGGLPEFQKKNQSSETKRFLLLQWLMFCLILTAAYTYGNNPYPLLKVHLSQKYSRRSTMSSLLITPVYLQPVDTIQDMLRSESQFIVPGGTAVPILVKIDPRHSMKELSKIQVTVPLTRGEFTQATRDRWAHPLHLLPPKHCFITVCKRGNILHCCRGLIDICLAVLSITELRSFSALTPLQWSQRKAHWKWECLLSHHCLPIKFTSKCLPCFRCHLIEN